MNSLSLRRNCIRLLRLFRLKEVLRRGRRILVQQLQSNEYRRKSLINTSQIERNWKKPSLKAKRGYYR
ncbi:hypothetical protein FGO68_gene14897 [Halteria grandinella]|uniref:Uncharacterized protein n=1 Tax=Halteria grandinella TaxID=5974 RepID=A0A8J8NWA8_HALGN|nr:hypothetical protein FGO68_gene14897 [Halteria grandinella]